MKNHITLWSIFILQWFASIAMAGAWLDSYWPLNDGDTKTFVYSGSNQLTMDTADEGGGEYEISDVSSASSASEFYENTGSGVYLEQASVDSGWVNIYLDPAVLLLTDSMLQNGGSTSTSTTVSQQGVSYPATYTITVGMAGTLVEPAGTFANCRNVTVTEKATVPGEGKVTANAMTAVLAPGVGIVRKLVSQGVWADLVSGTVGGVAVGILASGPPALTITQPVNRRPVYTNADDVVVAGRVTGYLPGMQVFYQANGGPWNSALVAGTNWSGSVSAQVGTNVINAYAQDSTGRTSAVSSVTFPFVVSSMLNLGITGEGTITPNDNGAPLQIGANYSLKASGTNGFGFVNWTDGNGTMLTNAPTLKFLMASNLTLIANFADVTRPTVSISAPRPNERWSNAVFTVTGKAGDNAAVSNVFYSLNGSTWLAVAATNNWADWMLPVTLTPGTNRIAVYAEDTSGNVSKTNSVSLVYVLSASLSVAANGEGTIIPNYNGARLQVGAQYAMKATGTNGFGWVNWTDGSGNVLTNGETLRFVMASNLTLVANFADVTKPVVRFIAPTTSTARLTNGLVTVQVRATDNVGVGNVEFYLNGQDFGAGAPETGTNLWFRNFALATGTNVVAVAAKDIAGNVSATNAVQLVYVNQQTNANAIIVSEHLVLTFYPGPPDFDNDLLQDTALLNAALNVPGLQAMSANTWSNLYLTVSFGYFSFAGSMSDADVLTGGTAVFDFADTNDPTGNPATTEQLTVDRAGDKLMVNVRVGNASNLYWPSSLIAGSYFQVYPYPMEPVFSERPTFALSLEDGDSLASYADITNIVYVTPKELGGGLEVTGAADFKPPTDLITAPVNGRRTTNAWCTITGGARDNVQVSNVWVQIDFAGWKLAFSTNQWTNWTATVLLVPGLNTVETYAVDASGNTSPTNTVMVTYLQSLLANVTAGNAPPTPPATPLILAGDGGMGFSANRFGFNFNGPKDRVVVVEVSPDLVSWQPLQTNTLAGLPIRFTDVQGTNYPCRFYRVTAR